MTFSRVCKGILRDKQEREDEGMRKREREGERVGEEKEE